MLGHGESLALECVGRHLEDAGLLAHGHADAGHSSVESSQETVYMSRQEEAVAAIHTIALAASSVALVPLQPFQVCVCVYLSLCASECACVTYVTYLPA